MKTLSKILLVTGFCLSGLIFKSQTTFSCNQATSTVNTTYYSNVIDSVRSTTNLWGIYLCGPNTTVYDTSYVQFSGFADREVFLNSGTTYITRLPPTGAAHFFYLKNGATLIIKLNPGYAYVYAEPSATVICTTGTVGVFNVCSTVTLPPASCSTGIEENNIQAKINIFPNPVSNVLQISTEQFFDKESEIEILNYVGQTVLITKFKNELDVSDLPNGIYILQLKNSQDQVAIKKLVVSR